MARTRNAYVLFLATPTSGAVVARLLASACGELGAVNRGGEVSVMAPIPPAGTSTHSYFPVRVYPLSASG